MHPPLINWQLSTWTVVLHFSISSSPLLHGKYSVYFAICSANLGHFFNVVNFFPKSFRGQAQSFPLKDPPHNVTWLPGQWLRNSQVHIRSSPHRPKNMFCKINLKFRVKSEIPKEKKKHKLYRGYLRSISIFMDRYWSSWSTHTSRYCWIGMTQTTIPASISCSPYWNTLPVFSIWAITK